MRTLYCEWCGETDCSTGQHEILVALHLHMRTTSELVDDALSEAEALRDIDGRDSEGWGDVSQCARVMCTPSDRLDALREEWATLDNVPTPHPWDNDTPSTIIRQCLWCGKRETYWDDELYGVEDCPALSCARDDAAGEFLDDIEDTLNSTGRCIAFSDGGESGDWMVIRTTS